MLKIYFEIKKIGFKEWIKVSNNKKIAFLLVALIICIIVLICLCVSFFIELMKFDKRIIIFFSLILLYALGCIYTVFDEISSKSRKLDQIKERKPCRLELMNFDYISITYCIVSVLKSCSSIIIFFLLSILMDIYGIEQETANEMYSFIYMYIIPVVVWLLILAILNGFIFTDVMILAKTEWFYDRKVKKILDNLKK